MSPAVPRITWRRLWLLSLLLFLAPMQASPPVRAVPIPPDSRSNDRWFQHIAIIVSDMQRAYEHLRRHRVQHASPGPQRLPDWNLDAGGIEAFYFRDPDGNHLEILQFPPDKGDPKWHAGGDRLFLGIDHTAIVVADTDASLRLYHDVLGLRIAGTAENHGIEQERLNNVFGARLRITALKAGAGPGIELLEYLSPATGRPSPADTRANDLWHGQIQLVVDDVAAAGAVLRQAGGRWVSPGMVDTDGTGMSFRSGLLARDSDGPCPFFTLARTGTRQPSMRASNSRVARESALRVKAPLGAIWFVTVTVMLKTR